jgi:hypothetical protein
MISPLEMLATAVRANDTAGAASLLARHTALRAALNEPLGWSLHGSRHSWRQDAGDYAETVEALLEAGAIAPPVTNDLDASAAVRGVLQRFAVRGTPG